MSVGSVVGIDAWSTSSGTGVRMVNVLTCCTQHWSSRHEDAVCDALLGIRTSEPHNKGNIVGYVPILCFDCKLVEIENQQIRRGFNTLATCKHEYHAI